jgi:hypothetical protein
MRPAASSSAIRSDQHCLVELLDVVAVLVRGSRQFAGVDRRPPEWMVRHIPVRVVEVDPIRIERGSQCAAGISRRGWDEHALEPRLGQDAGIGHAVERDASAKT